MRKSAISLALLAGAVLAVLGWRQLSSLGQPLTPLWHGPALEARVLQSGYGRNAKSGHWEPEATLRFVNTDARKRFHRELHVDFVDSAGKRLGSTRTFVTLPAGAAQHRRYRAPSRLACAAELPACPEISVRVRELEGQSSPLPRLALQVEASPPEGQDVYASRVLDGDTFELTTGQRIRLLGIDTPERAQRQGKGPERLSREAGDHTRKRALEGPLRLSFDGERQDAYGRWLMLVELEDGSLLNLELLRLGLARVYERAEFSRKAAFIEAESAAKESGLGLWSAPKH